MLVLGSHPALASTARKKRELKCCAPAISPVVARLNMRYFVQGEGIRNRPNGGQTVCPSVAAHVWTNLMHVPHQVLTSSLQLRTSGLSQYMGDRQILCEERKSSHGRIDRPKQSNTKPRLALFRDDQRNPRVPKRLVTDNTDSVPLPLYQQSFIVSLRHTVWFPVKEEGTGVSAYNRHQKPSSLRKST